MSMMQDAGVILRRAATSLHSTWAKSKAIQNYEIFMNADHGANPDWATHIDIVAATSLGIEGWALYDIGTLDEPGTSSTSSTAVREGRGAAGRGSAPLSILLRGIESYPLACVDPPGHRPLVHSQ